MSFMSFPEPPTQATLADARRSLNETRISVMQMSSKIDKAEAELEQLVHDSKTIINQMQQERACLQEHLLQTMAYLSPIRRLPTDLLSDIFMWSFEDYSCQAWILASVCSSWRRLALRMPRIWSKVRSHLFFNLPLSFVIRVHESLPQRAPVSSGLTCLLLSLFLMQSIVKNL